MCNARTDEVRPGERANPMLSQRMVLLATGGRLFGIAIESIREIITARPFTPLPGAADHVCGLINVRGRIVTVVDLAARLQLPRSVAGPDHRVVLVDHRGKRVGIAVDEVVRIVDVDSAEVDGSAETLRALGLEEQPLRGVGTAGEQVFVAIDPDEILRSIIA
jgi:purine-binding chemotaxis protein CheW